METEDLPPTQYLIMETLAARARLGETCWPFPTRLRPALTALQDRGLLWFDSGPVPGRLRTFLTSQGRADAMSETYSPPILQSVQPSTAAVTSYMLAKDWKPGGDGLAGRLWSHADYEHEIAVFYDAEPGTMAWRGVIDRLARAEGRSFGAVVTSVWENERGAGA